MQKPSPDEIEKRELPSHHVELELELIQPQMAQRPILRDEVSARALRVRSVSREEVWAGAGVKGASPEAPMFCHAA